MIILLTDGKKFKSVVNGKSMKGNKDEEGGFCMCAQDVFYHCDGKRRGKRQVTCM